MRDYDKVLYQVNQAHQCMNKELVAFVQVPTKERNLQMEHQLEFPHKPLYLTYVRQTQKVARNNFFLL